MAFRPTGIADTSGLMSEWTVAASVTPAGSTQGDATALTANINHVTSGAAGTGVRLPSATEGAFCLVYLTGLSGSVNIYPASGDDLGAGTDTAWSSGSGCWMFYAVSDSRWTEIFG